MTHRILLAGASGAIGQRLVPLLHDAGYHVTGTTRSSAKAEHLRTLGVEAVVVDVFDADALTRVVADAHPDTVIHQLTDLSPGTGTTDMGQAIARNARIRNEGTRNLVNATIAAGARRLIAQSIAWAYAPGGEPHSEADPLDIGASGTRGISVGGVVALENLVLTSPCFSGVVLRYGQLYGPGTGVDAPAGTTPLHVEAAAYAARLAVDRNLSGVFNIAEPNDQVAIERARNDLGWRSDFRLHVVAEGAPR